MTIIAGISQLQDATNQRISHNFLFVLLNRKYKEILIFLFTDQTNSHLSISFDVARVQIWAAINLRIPLRVG